MATVVKATSESAESAPGAGELRTRSAEARSTLRLYDELADWWPLVGDAATEYAAEAGVYADLLAEACDGPIALAINAMANLRLSPYFVK